MKKATRARYTGGDPARDQRPGRACGLRPHGPRQDAARADGCARPPGAPYRLIEAAAIGDAAGNGQSDCRLNGTESPRRRTHEFHLTPSR